MDHAEFQKNVADAEASSDEDSATPVASKSKTTKKRATKKRATKTVAAQSTRRPGFHTTQETIASMSDAQRKQLEAKFITNYFARKRMLVVPDEILAANPDKHFVWLNYPRLEQNGMWHHKGYRPYTTSAEDGHQSHQSFKDGADNLVRRNEMVLAYISKEEWNMMQLEKRIMNESQNLEDVLTSNPDLVDNLFSCNIETSKISAQDAMSEDAIPMSASHVSAKDIAQRLAQE